MAEVFVAQFRSRCPACGEPIEVGADARSSGTGGWIHADCDPPEPVETRPARPVLPACRRCFQVPAANGTCGCES